MQENDFLLILQHFQKLTKESKERKLLLLLDNHSSHISVKCIDFCKENGIVLLSFPLHCSYKMQPLDRPVYGPFKRLVNSASNSWMKMNPAKPMTIYNIPGIMKSVFPAAMTPRNIQAGFEVTGVWPFNPEVFQDCDFDSSAVTNRPNPEDVTERNQASTHSKYSCPTQSPIIATNLNLDGVALVSIALSQTNPSCSSECFDASTSDLNINPCDDSEARETSCVVDTTVICINPDASAEELCCSTVSPQFNPTDVRPMPKAGPRKGNHKRKKKRRSEILTATPVREKLAEEEAKKVNGKAKKKLFDREKDYSKQDAKLRKKPGRRLRKKRTSVTSSSDEEDEWFCVVCRDTYNNSKPGKKWVKCSYCDHWAHEACTDGGFLFVCVHCESDGDL